MAAACAFLRGTSLVLAVSPSYLDARNTPIKGQWVLHSHALAFLASWDSYKLQERKRDVSPREKIDVHRERRHARARFGNMLLEQFGGANGELAAALQYSIQGLNCDDPDRQDLLMDICTEELRH